MSTSDSWVEILRELKAGDERAIEEIGDRIREKVLKRARHKLDKLCVRGVESQDIANEVLLSLWRGAGKGRFPRLESEDDVLQVVYMLIAQKVVNWRRRREPEFTESRVEQGDFQASDVPGLANVGGQSIPPDVTADLEERLTNFFLSLDGVELAMVLFHINGLSNPEIAKQLGCSLSSVERKLPRLKKQLQRLFGPDEESSAN